MSRRDARSSSKYEIYPRRYFDASPTWFAWNNLTAQDVVNLRTQPGFEGQQIYFHLNHPIKFVRLVGLVVDIEVKAGKYIVISLDDGSGSCLEVKTSFRQVKEDDRAKYPSNTIVDNFDVHVRLGLPTLHIDKQAVEIGDVIKVKGTIDTFRNTRQLKLERISTVKDTSAEVRAWTETANWKRDVLSKPWVLTKEKRDEIDGQIRRDEVKQRERTKKRRAYDEQYAEQKKRKLEKVEAKRKHSEEKYNAGALSGSSNVLMRITDS